MANTPIHPAAWRGHALLWSFFLGVVELLPVKGAPVEAVDRKGKTPLQCAMLGGHAGVVELLLEKSASLESILHSILL